MMDLDSLRQHLSAENLPDDVRDFILANGAEHVDSLLAIFDDRSLWAEDSPGQGWAPVHAAHLLGALKAVGAIEPMLQAMQEIDCDDILFTAIVRSLGSFGAAVMEPTLDALACSPDATLRGIFCEILACCRTRDERIFAVLVECFARGAENGAANLAMYGDARAVPYLAAALEAHVFGINAADDDPGANPALIELVDALDILGGDLTPSQSAKKDLITQRRHQHRVSLTEPDPDEALEGLDSKQLLELLQLQLDQGGTGELGFPTAEEKLLEMLEGASRDDSDDNNRLN
jgi:hypothetical protein